MARLTTEHVLKDKRTNDPNSITSLSLTHKALSDISCLSEFSNLERLDLAFNSLTSLQGLGSCVNLKWLSVVQNKLQSLKGIETLSKLTVLNAGKNKLKSLDEVRSLGSLRALILNDNEIVSICKLDQLKELNTLVLSRNPISEIGESLVKVKSLSKLSLSNCQIQTIDSSLKSCIELKELRIAHNDIKTLPADLSSNKKLQILDLGNNVLSTWSDVKVLKSLGDLKNLNLQGNPIAENDKIAKKVQKLLPTLHVFNSRPIVKSTTNAVSAVVNDFSLTPANEFEVDEEEKKDQRRKKKSSKNAGDKSEGRDFDNVSELGLEKGVEQEKKNTMVKRSKKQEVAICNKDDTMIDKKLKRKKILEQQDNVNDLNMKGLEQKRKKTKDNVHKDGNTAADKKPRENQSELDIIDNGEAAFTELFAVDAAENPKHGGEKKIGKKAESGLVAITLKKKKKDKTQGVDITLQLPSGIEVGMGGPSAWGDE